MCKTIVNLVEANLESPAGVWTVGWRHTIIGHDFSLMGVYKLMRMNYLYIYFDDFTLPIINFPDLNCLLFESTWCHSCLFNYGVRVLIIFVFCVVFCVLYVFVLCLVHRVPCVSGMFCVSGLFCVSDMFCVSGMFCVYGMFCVSGMSCVSDMFCVSGMFCVSDMFILDCPFGFFLTFIYYFLICSRHIYGWTSVHLKLDKN